LERGKVSTMGRAIPGCLIFASVILAQTSTVVLVPSRYSGGSEKYCYIEFRELASNGRDYFRLACPTEMTAPINYQLPAEAGQEHDSLAVTLPSGPSEFNGALKFRPMVTAYDDDPRIQLIEGKKRFGRPVDVQSYVAVWDDTDFSSPGAKSIYGGGYLTLRENPEAITPAVLMDITGLEMHDEDTGLTRVRLNKGGLLLMTSDAGAVKYKIENSIETLPEISTPSTLPAAGFVFRYAKAGTACTLDSGGIEVCIGASSAVTVNPISYIYSTTNQLRLEQQGDGLGTSTLYLRHRVGESGATVECSDYDLCEFNAKGSASQMSLRMEGRSGSKLLPLGGSVPEWQIGQSTNYPADYTLSVNREAAGVLNGKPLLFVSTAGGYAGLVAPPSAANYLLSLPVALDASVGKALCTVGFTSTLGWCSISSSAPANMVTTDTTQTISGTKYASGFFNAAYLGIRPSAGSGNAVQHLIGAGGQGISEWFNSSGSRSLQVTGNYSFGLPAISMINPSTQNPTIGILGGSASSAAIIQILDANTGAEMVSLRGSGPISPYVSVNRSSGAPAAQMGRSTIGGYFWLYDNSGNQIFSVDSINGIRAGTSLEQGLSATFDPRACTSITTTFGLITGKTGC
jgi:hypothetical protein